MSQAVVAALRERLGASLLAVHAQFGDDTVVIERGALLAACRLLKEDPRLSMKMLMDLTVVDYLAWRPSLDGGDGGAGGTHEPLHHLASGPLRGAADPRLRYRLETDRPRFEVVYHLYSPERKHRLRLKVPLADVDDGYPEVDSVVSVWRGADWYEREAWDFYGIVFRGHPDLRRILLYEEFEGHPLRKDYPKEHRQPLARRGGLGQGMVHNPTLSTPHRLRPAGPSGDGNGRRRLVLGAPDYHATPQAGDDQPTEHLHINMGPSHPAMHGTVRLVLTLEGETVVEVDVELGYLHRGFEKEAEAATYTQVFPYTDRMNYASPMLNAIAYAHAVEKLLGLGRELPLRAQFLRVITGELSRITDHLTCNGASSMELGAFTPFLWMMKARDWIYRLLEELTGARLTYSWIRIGGVASDAPEGWTERVAETLPRIREVMDECRRVLVDHRIFRDRMEGVGAISPEDAMAFGFTGPQLRSTGVDLDVRRDHPYLVYDRLEFDVAVGTTGDCYDRFLVRFAEISESIRIIEQALEQMPPGPILVDDPLVTLPPKPEVYDTIEGMIRHFKVVFDGIKVPPGEAYAYTESANGELGFYVVADGSGRPYKCRSRGPSFTMTQALPHMILGRQIADIIPIFGQINYIGGEAER